MKGLALIVGICLILALAACGGGDSTTTAQDPSTQGTSSAAAQDSGAQPDGTSPKSTTVPKQPTVRVPQGPAPTELVVREVKKGSGPVLNSNEKITFRYVGVEYRSGKTFEVRWDEPFVIQEFGNGELLEGEEMGMRGMRVGGRRELIIPERLGYDTGVGSLIYMIELVSIEK